MRYWERRRLQRLKVRITENRVVDAQRLGLDPLRNAPARHRLGRRRHHSVPLLERRSRRHSAPRLERRRHLPPRRHVQVKRRPAGQQNNSGPRSSNSAPRSSDELSVNVLWSNSSVARQSSSSA